MELLQCCPDREVDRAMALWQNQALNKYAPVAQRKERRPPKPKARVRVTAGVL